MSTVVLGCGGKGAEIRHGRNDDYDDEEEGADHSNNEDENYIASIERR